MATLLSIAACGLVHRHRAEDRPAPVDLNAASLRKIERLPGVTPTMARRIVDGRPYEDPHDLVERGILTERELARIHDLVSVQHHGG